MTIGNRIGQYRRKLGLTQEALAQKLEVTNQAVSKWESDQCCPDISLLPRLADIFGITIDELFGREAPVREQPQPEPAPEAPKAELPWEDDKTLRVVLYVGHQLVAGNPARDRIEFCYEGPALNVHSECSVNCDDVAGNVTAGRDVNCDNVGGDVRAEGSVNCDDVDGNVSALGDVNCDCVEGSVSAGDDVNCDEINGSVSAGRDVICDELNGEAVAGGTVRSGESGDGINITIHGDAKCEEDGGSFHVTIGPDGKVKFG